MKKLLLGLSFFVCQSVCASLDAPLESKTNARFTHKNNVYRLMGGDPSDVSVMIQTLTSQNPFSNDPLTTFVSVETDITPEDLAQMLKDLPLHVTGLYLSGPDMNDEAMQLIVESIENNVLCHLDLFHCGVTDKHVESLARALGANSSLTHLGLYEQSINQSSLPLVFKALKKNKTLTVFDCTGNVEEETVKVLDEALETNHTLQEVLYIADGAYNPPLPLYATIEASLERNRLNAPNRGLTLTQRLLAHCHESGFLEDEPEVSGAASSGQSLSDDRFSKRGPNEPYEGEGAAKRQRR